MKNLKQCELPFEPIAAPARRVIQMTALARALHVTGRRQQHSVQYTSHLRSDAWRDTRRRLIAQSQQRCERCGRFANYLEVHHRTYRNLGDELDEDLEVLCNPCHNEADEERENMAAYQDWD